MVSNKSHKRSLKTQAFLNLAILITAITVINLLASQYYTRLDLTKEKRFSLSSTTKNTIKNLQDKIIFKVYLDGNLSSKFKQLQSNLRDMLAEFANISNGKVEYTFANPLAGKDLKEQEDIIVQLEKKGLIPYYEEQESENQAQINRLFPGAEVIDNNGNEYVVNFLTTEMARAEENAINSSIENLEYEIANIIRKVAAKGKNKKIGFLQGHGELTEPYTFDIRKELSTFYTVENINLNLTTKETLSQIASKIEMDSFDEKNIFTSMLQHLNTFKGLIMAKPTQPFSKAEIFLLDQYIMNGGKVLFLVDPVFTEYDSIAKYEKMLSFPYDLGELSNMLYIYGVRLDNNLLMEARCHDIVMRTKNGVLKNHPWVYYPAFTDNGLNPISKNIEVILGRFVSTIKPIPRDNQIQTPILLSSDKCKTVNSPSMVELALISQNNNPAFLRTLNKGKQICGILNTGRFQSVFKGRNTNEYTGIKAINQIENNALIVISDGDIIKNSIKSMSDGYFPLGLDLATGKTFGNKKFMLNCIDYLCDDEGLIEVRNKEFQLRLLDKNKVSSSKRKWQLITVLLPIILVILLGFVNHFIRIKKYKI